MRPINCCLGCYIWRAGFSARGVEAMALAWSVIHTKVARELSTAMGISQLGFPTFYPLHRRTRIHNHRIESLIGPLFPRYIFVQFDRDKDEWGDILSTKGVRDVLRNCDGKPCQVPDQVMAEMKTRLDASPEAVQPDPIYSVGQRVKITDGVLEGFEALFEGSAQQRTYAMLEIIGRKVKVPMKSIVAV